jgi:hypothetical protein
MMLEGSHSGLVRTLGKRVWGNPPRVRISYPPHYEILRIDIYLTRWIAEYTFLL